MKYFISLKSFSLTSDEKNLLSKDEVCGVVLFGKNILGAETTKRLIRDIKSVKKELKIAVDEEGGIVSRFTHLMANYSQPYCATLPTNQVREYYKTRSNCMRDIGIDVNFAPVVDQSLSETSYLYKRSYGADINKIIELSQICIEEQRKAGLESCLKHFPGHGRVVEDSHAVLPIVNITNDEWKNNEFKIFKNLIDFGVENIMVGHLKFPMINNQIASVSTYWIKNILKRDLGFKGKVISDDICMKGLSDNIDIKDKNIFNEAGLDELIITEQENELLKVLL